MLSSGGGCMGKTISTHNGSAANRAHNIRNPKATDKQAHIDKALRDGNEIILDEPPREAYKRIFGAALADYNEKQTRPERRIKNYFNHIEADQKKHAVYEMIVQIGDRNDTGIYAPTERAIIKEFIAGWKERNPNLELIGAYIHADERDGTLHAHLDYVPVAHGYKNGLHTQNGLVKALGEQGFNTVKKDKETAQIRWERRENEALEVICNRYGVEVEHPMRDKPENKRKHLNTPEYKEYAAEIIAAKDELALFQDLAESERLTVNKIIAETQEKEIEVEKLTEKIKDLKSQEEEAQQKAAAARATIDALKAEIKPYKELKKGMEKAEEFGKSMPFGMVAIKKEDLNPLIEGYKAYSVNREEIGSLRNREKALSNRESRADERERQLNDKEKKVAKDAETVANNNKTVMNMYERQKDVNNLLERTEQENTSLKAENGSLRDEIEKLKENLAVKLEAVTKGFRAICESFTAAVQAVGMLKWDKSNGYKANLTEKQERLIDAINKYGAERAERPGFKDLADKIRKTVRISDGIEKEIKALEPSRHFSHNER